MIDRLTPTTFIEYEAGIHGSTVGKRYSPRGDCEDCIEEMREHQAQGVFARISGTALTVHIDGTWHLWVEVSNVRTRTTRRVARNRHR